MESLVTSKPPSDTDEIAKLKLELLVKQKKIELLELDLKLKKMM